MMYFKKIILIVLLILINKNIHSQQIQESETTIKYEKIELNQENLAKMIVLFEIQHPEMVYKQIILESGNLKSKLAVEGNNLCGMRLPKKRRTLALKKKLYGYAVYPTWVHSVEDYKIWQGTDKIKDYRSFLKRRKYSVITKYDSLSKKNVSVFNENYIKLLEKIKIPKHILEILNKKRKFEIDLDELNENKVIKEGKAIVSYYGGYFHGRLTASGEKFNKYAFTSAHKKLPFGTLVKITNLNNDKSVIVRINDRGPFIKGREFDLSESSAKEIDLSLGKCKYEILK